MWIAVGVFERSNPCAPHHCLRVGHHHASSLQADQREEEPHAHDSGKLNLKREKREEE